MPELPEAETVRRQLEPQIVGARITTPWSRLARRTRPGVEEWVKAQRRQVITGARRRGKQLFFPLSNGRHLLVHLGMTGRLRVDPGGPRRVSQLKAEKHVHALWPFQDGRIMVFTDPRTFGEVAIEDEPRCLRSMGPEPLDEDFDPEALVAKLMHRKTRIKAALLDQKLVCGLGNIYADEACFLARVHPAMPACLLSRRKLRELVGTLRPVLEKAIAARGATLKDGGYQDTFGVYGEFYPDAYGRTGLPCPRCGTAIRRGTLGSGRSARSYHYCPRCQRLPRQSLPDES